MNVLLLVQKEQRIILDALYESIGDHCHLDLRWLSSGEQANLKKYFSQIDVDAYDRVIFFLRFKKEVRQVAFIRSIPNLVILEHDAWQNYYKDSKYAGKFSRHYEALPWARILVSGHTLAQKLQQEGFDAVFSPKGYDNKLLQNLNHHRDINAGFVGSIDHTTYSQRKYFLGKVQQKIGLQSTRTNSGEEYANALNRIRFFVSADIGFGEYMIKNFEAMACGCILCAHNQGENENHALGFKDMENIILYTNLDELEAKLDQVKADADLERTISQAGQNLAENRYSFQAIGKTVVDAITGDLRPWTGPRPLDPVRYLFRR